MSELHCVCAGYLPDVGALGLRGPGDDARHGQARLTGVDKVPGVHLACQAFDVLQDGHLHLGAPTTSWLNQRPKKYSAEL